MTAIVRMTDVTKTYRLGSRRVPALRGVNLLLESADFYGIMGPSGSGKSTLLHLLAALDRPDTGTIEVAGERIDQLDERALTRFRRRRIGLIFQRYNLIPTLSAVENVALPALLDGMRKAERLRRAHDLLDRLGLTERADHRPDALSGGEQQRVAIARALIFEPQILFADEPTGNLDSQTAAQIWTLLRQLADVRQITVLMVTHEPAAAAHCSLVYLLRDGVIESSFQPEGLDAADLATRAQQSVG